MEALKVGTWRVDKLIDRYGITGYGFAVFLFQMIDNDPQKKIPIDTVKYLWEKHSLYDIEIYDFLSLLKDEINIIDNDEKYISLLGQPSVPKKKTRPVATIQTNDSNIQHQERLYEALDLRTDLSVKENIAHNWMQLSDFINTYRPAFPEPYAAIWNLFASKYNLSQIKDLTAERIAKIRDRVQEPNFDFIRILKHISKSDFCLGKTSKWKVSFDFIIKSESSYLKVLENKYE